MSVKVLSLPPAPGASPEEGVWVACNLNAQATSAVSFHDNRDKRNIVLNSLTIIYSCDMATVKEANISPYSGSSDASVHP